MSETSKLRKYLLPYCNGNGIDIGFGGEKIKENAIGIERQFALMHCGDQAVNLVGSAEDLYWFKNSVLDYVYSSHVLEDFEEEKCIDIIDEWVRVIKYTGHLVLCLPDEPIFYKHCVTDGKQCYNYEHKNHNMSIDFMRKTVEEYNKLKTGKTLKEVLCTGVLHIYNFGMVWEVI